MVRKLKYHEHKLLKKVDFISWPDNNVHEAVVMRRFHLKNHEEYTLYNKLSREVRDIAKKIKELPANSPVRIEKGSQLIEKLYAIGVIPTKHGLHLCDNVNASSFCRRRLPVIMVKNNMAENLSAAVKFIEHGHVRVGPEAVTDPAFLVTRNLEDFITWTNYSAIRKHVMEYNEMRDDLMLGI